MGGKILKYLYDNHTPGDTILLLIYSAELVKVKVRNQGKLSKDSVNAYYRDIGVSNVGSYPDLCNCLVHDICNIEAITDALSVFDITVIVKIADSFNVNVSEDIISNDIDNLVSWLKELNEKED